jgi:pimeloyl-ACP methyl ester carboxylesterase
MITAEWDGALPPRMAAGMTALCSDLEMHNIERAGHWVQQEFPDAVNQTIVDWLNRRFKKS